MELQVLQNQLKTAIQNHQIVLAKMQGDPQNTALQAQLHDLQADIMALSEKQKQVVQQLRKELEKKQQSVTAATATPLKVVQTSPKLMPRASVTVPGKQIFQSVVGGLALKGSVATAVLLPNATIVSRPTATARSQPLLVVPSLGNRSVEGTNMVLNLTPPIRVPQYPPPVTRSTIVNTSVTTAATQVTSVSSHTCVISNTVGDTKASSNLKTATPACAGPPHVKVVAIPAAKAQAACLQVKRENLVQAALCIKQADSTLFSSKSGDAQKAALISSEKVSFMTSLGLMTKEALSELQNKRGERKRRTTANPQFSNAALEEKRKNAALLNAESLSSQLKRPRGRPRVGSTPTNSRPTTPEVSSTENIIINGHSSPRQSPPDVKPVIGSTPNKEFGCDQCSDELRKHCPLSPGSWSCQPVQDSFSSSTSALCHHSIKKSPPVCHSSSWVSSTAIVSDYAALKAAKEEEKLKLMKRSLELKSERMQLEERLQHLAQVAANQQQRKKELRTSQQDVQDSIKKLERFIQYMKEVS